MISRMRRKKEYGYYWVIKKDGYFYVSVYGGYTGYRSKARRFNVNAPIHLSGERVVRIKYRRFQQLPKLENLCEWIGHLSALATAIRVYRSEHLWWQRDINLVDKIFPKSD